MAWGASAHAQAPAQEVGPDKPPDINTGVLFDLNVAAPAVPGGGVLLIGDGSIGYQWERIGGLASGSFNAYGLVSSSAIASSRRLTGNIDLWGSLSSSDTRFELRPTFGYAVYESERLSLSSDVAFFAERSLMVRMGNMVGVRYEPEGRRPFASLGLDVFYTASDEEPNATSVVPSAGLGLRHSAF
jgi:hypothetical protein